MSTKQCSRCRKAFECRNEKPGCWCEDLYLNIETLQKLKQDYDNCLCPDCLKEYSVPQNN